MRIVNKRRCGGARMYRDEDDDDRDESGQWMDREMPDAADVDAPGDSADVDTEPCPFCRKPVYERAEVCPHCGNFLSREDAIAPRREGRQPLWVIIAAIACLAAILFVWLR
jgi:hypothetical protein